MLPKQEKIKRKYTSAHDILSRDSNPWNAIFWSRDVSNNKQVRGDSIKFISIYIDLVWYHFHNFVNTFFIFSLVHLFNKYLCSVCSVLSSQLLQLHFPSFTTGLVKKGLNITAHTADRMLVSTYSPWNILWMCLYLYGIFPVLFSFFFFFCQDDPVPN